jgi:hypothetical protein
MADTQQQPAFQAHNFMTSPKKNGSYIASAVFFYLCVIMLVLIVITFVLSIVLLEASGKSPTAEDRFKVYRPHAPGLIVFGGGAILCWFLMRKYK